MASRRDAHRRRIGRGRAICLVRPRLPRRLGRGDRRARGSTEPAGRLDEFADADDVALCSPAASTARLGERTGGSAGTRSGTSGPAPSAAWLRATGSNVVFECLVWSWIPPPHPPSPSGCRVLRPPAADDAARTAAPASTPSRSASAAAGSSARPDARRATPPPARRAGSAWRRSRPSRPPGTLAVALHRVGGHRHDPAAGRSGQRARIAASPRGRRSPASGRPSARRRTPRLEHVDGFADHRRRRGRSPSARAAASRASG